MFNQHFFHWKTRNKFHRNCEQHWNAVVFISFFLFFLLKTTTSTIIPTYLLNKTYSKLISACTSLFAFYIYNACTYTRTMHFTGWPFNCHHNKFMYDFLFFISNLVFVFRLFAFFFLSGHVYFADWTIFNTHTNIHPFLSHLQSTTTVNIQLHQNHRINIHREYTAMQWL